MPAINVNPIRPGRMGAPGFPILGRNESALRKSPAAICGAKAPSPRGGAPLKSDGGARRGGVSHACD